MLSVLGELRDPLSPLVRLGLWLALLAQTSPYLAVRGLASGSK